MAGEHVSLRVARMLERRVPRLAQRIAAPRVTGATFVAATEGTSAHWVSTDSSPASAQAQAHPPAVLIVTDHPISARWLGASLSVALDARVSVSRSDSVSSTDLAVDAIVGVGAAVGAAITLCRRSQAGRLALVSPVALPASVPSGLPTTLIQSASSGSERPKVQVFERTLRATGTAVRDTDYPETPDEWVRLPRLIRGSSAALDDLVAFLERGIGVQSTFEVIPGWDLH